MTPTAYTGGLPSVTVVFHATGRSIRFESASVIDLLASEWEEVADHPHFEAVIPTGPELPPTEENPS